MCSGYAMRPGLLIVQIGGASLALYSTFQAYSAISVGVVKAFGRNSTVAFGGAPGEYAFWLVGWLFGAAAGTFLFFYSRWLADR